MKKSLTGIKGLDEITAGGLPAGRATLLAGNVGSGKTTFAMSFLAQGIAEGEPGLFVTLEETAEEIISDMQSVSIDLLPLIEQGKLHILHIDLRQATLTETESPLVF